MSETTEPKSSAYAKRPMWQWLVIYLIIGAIVYGLIYYFVLAKRGGYNSSNTPYQQPTSAQTVTTQPTETKTNMTNSKAQSITIEGSDFAFKPSTLTLKKGIPVEVTFKNAGSLPHNFVVSDLNVASKIVAPGQTITFSFTPDKSGTFTYICSVDSHADKGMTGTLTVE